jgi:hypothetical protein
VSVGVDAVGGGGGEVHQGADGGVGAGVGALFEDLSEEDDGRDEGGGLEVERHAVGVGVERGGEFRAEDDGGDAVEVSGTGAGHGEREHVRIALAEGFGPAADEEPAGPEKDGGGQGELEPGGEARVEDVRERRDEHGAHREDEDGQREGEGDVEARTEDAFMGQAHVNGGVGRRYGRGRRRSRAGARRSRGRCVAGG